VRRRLSDVFLDFSEDLPHWQLPVLSERNQGHEKSYGRHGSQPKSDNVRLS